MPAPLPPLAGLTALPGATWRELTARFDAAGVTPARLHEIASIGSRMPPGARPALAHFHLRRAGDVAATLMRLLFFADPCPRAAAHEALGAGLCDTLEQAGLLVEADGGLVSPLLLNLVGRLWILTDDLTRGGDAVMGAGETTADLCNAMMPRAPIDAALDLGCGAGSVALLLAGRARRAVGTDVNPRAIELSRINARLNAIDNVEFRAGDGYAPVAGERFDLVVSQPPFVARPTASDDVTYLYGGARGDELALRLLAQTPPMLAPHGKAIVLVEWPLIDGVAPIAERVRTVLPPGPAGLLVLEGPSRDLDAYCLAYAASECGGFGPAFSARAAARRQHFLDAGVRDLHVGLVVIDADPDGAGYTRSFPIRALTEAQLDRRRIDAIVAACRLLERDDDALLTARLRITTGTRFVEERDDPADDEPARIEAHFAPTGLFPSVALNRPSLALLGWINGAESVGSVVDQLALQWGVDGETAAGRVLPAVRETLLAGLLEPVDASS